MSELITPKLSARWSCHCKNTAFVSWDECSPARARIFRLVANASDSDISISQSLGTSSISCCFVAVSPATVLHSHARCLGCFDRDGLEHRRAPEFPKAERIQSEPLQRGSVFSLMRRKELFPTQPVAAAYINKGVVAFFRIRQEARVSFWDGR